jgi:hypothetical protein
MAWLSLRVGPLVKVEVDEVRADGRGRGFLVAGVVDAEPGEDVQGVLPVCAGQLVLVERVVGMGEAVVGARLIVRLAYLVGERERPVVVGEATSGWPAARAQPSPCNASNCARRLPHWRAWSSSCW